MIWNKIFKRKKETPYYPLNELDEFVIYGAELPHDTTDGEDNIEDSELYTKLYNKFNQVFILDENAEIENIHLYNGSYLYDFDTSTLVMSIDVKFQKGTYVLNDKKYSGVIIYSEDLNKKYFVSDFYMDILYSGEYYSYLSNIEIENILKGVCNTPLEDSITDHGKKKITYDVSTIIGNSIIAINKSLKSIYSELYCIDAYMRYNKNDVKINLDKIINNVILVNSKGDKEDVKNINLVLTNKKYKYKSKTIKLMLNNIIGTDALDQIRDCKAEDFDIDIFLESENPDVPVRRISYDELIYNYNIRYEEDMNNLIIE